MKALVRIAVALERIADALEKLANRGGTLGFQFDSRPIAGEAAVPPERTRRIGYG